MSRIIVTAADENYADLLVDLLDSLDQFGAPLADAIGVLDVGLSPQTLSNVSARVTSVVQPGWDLRVSSEIMETKPHLRAMTARPFLREHFPGFDTYLWLDADTWVQNSSALDLLFRASESGSLAIAPEVHPSYGLAYEAHLWRIDRLNAYYGEIFSRNEATPLNYNSGVFALRADAPHWDAWAEWFQLGLTRSHSAFVTDQIALNFAIWNVGLPVHPLPATCNWLCHFSMPSIDLATGRLHEPRPPHGEIGILHMTGPEKYPVLRIRDDQGEKAIPLNFRSRDPLRGFRPAR